jgi:hypothetical protein
MQYLALPSWASGIHTVGVIWSQSAVSSHAASAGSGPQQCGPASPEDVLHTSVVLGDETQSAFSSQWSPLVPRAAHAFCVNCSLLSSGRHTCSHCAFVLHV